MYNGQCMWSGHKLTKQIKNLNLNIKDKLHIILFWNESILPFLHKRMKIKYFLLPFVERLNNRKDEFSALLPGLFFLL